MIINLNEIESFSPKEIISLAFHSEVKAEQVYLFLKKKIKNKLLRRKLDFLGYEQARHAELLKRFFNQKYPQESMPSPKISFWPEGKVFLTKSSSIKDLFIQALENEKIFENFYLSVSRLMKSPPLRHVFKYLSRVERTHYFIIKTELDLLEKFPDYYQVEDFHFGDELVHIGP